MRAERADGAAPRRRFEPWPWGIAGLLAAMIASSLLLLRVAAGHPDGLVVADAWSAGQAFNRAVAARAAADAEGLTLAVETRATRDGVRVEAAVAGERAAGAAPPLRVSVRRLRPAEAGYDADFPLAPDGEGFSGEVPLPLAGRWRLVVVAAQGDAALREPVEVWRGAEPRG